MVAGAVDNDGTSSSRRVGGVCPTRDFCLTWEGAGGTEGFVDGLVSEGSRVEPFRLLAADSSRQEGRDSSRFFAAEADEGAARLDCFTAVIMEGLNLDGASDPRSATSCGLVHFE